MKNMSEGPLLRHLLGMSIPIAIGLLAQTLYVLVDLYFVSRLGSHAVAGVSAGGVIFFLVLSLTQILSVGSVSLMSRGIGAKDWKRVSTVFCQSFILAVVLACIMLVGGYILAPTFMQTLAADEAVRTAGVTYLYWYLPGLALQPLIACLGAAMRAAGNMNPVMMVQMATVFCNIILAPVLIAGWGTGHPLGVAGAGLASTLSIAAGAALLVKLFANSDTGIALKANLFRPQSRVWGEIVGIGLPAGGEFVFMAVTTSVTYWALRTFGPDVQAGFAIGGRVLQVLFLPAMAVGFALPAVAGQNFGAKRAGRVRESFWLALQIEVGLMLAMTILCQARPDLIVGIFALNTQAAAAGVLFIRIISWNFVAAGIVFACSGMFQALGKTLPSLASAGLRLIAFSLPVVYLEMRGGFALPYVWYISVASTVLQAFVSLLFIRRVLNRKLAQLNEAIVDDIRCAGA